MYSNTFELARLSAKEQKRWRPSFDAPRRLLKTATLVSTKADAMRSIESAGFACRGSGLRKPGS
jgi:hypothetical protein